MLWQLGKQDFQWYCQPIQWNCHRDRWLVRNRPWLVHIQWRPSIDVWSELRCAEDIGQILGSMDGWQQSGLYASNASIGYNFNPSKSGIATGRRKWGNKTMYRRSRRSVRTARFLPVPLHTQWSNSPKNSGLGHHCFCRFLRWNHHQALAFRLHQQILCPSVQAFLYARWT